MYIIRISLAPNVVFHVYSKNVPLYNIYRYRYRYYGITSDTEIGADARPELSDENLGRDTQPELSNENLGRNARPTGPRQAVAVLAGRHVSESRHAAQRRHETGPVPGVHAEVDERIVTRVRYGQPVEREPYVRLVAPRAQRHPVRPQHLRHICAEHGYHNNDIIL